MIVECCKTGKQEVSCKPAKSITMRSEISKKIESSQTPEERKARKAKMMKLAQDIIDGRIESPVVDVKSTAL